MTTLPPLSSAIHDSTSDGPLARALVTLFESSPVLHDHLVPQVARSLLSHPVNNYSEFIDLALHVIRSQWSDDLKAEFVGGHPRIGEVINLSALSSGEQAAAQVLTPPEVLARLEHLNALYEHKYPALRYITFVNGRSRAVIAEEMEDVLGIQRSLSATDPPIESVGQVEVGGDAWKAELERAIEDVGRIARNRMRKLGVDMT